MGSLDLRIRSLLARAAGTTRCCSDASVGSMWHGTVRRTTGLRRVRHTALHTTRQPRFSVHHTSVFITQRHARSSLTALSAASLSRAARVASCSWRTFARSGRPRAERPLMLRYYAPRPAWHSAEWRPRAERPLMLRYYAPRPAWHSTTLSPDVLLVQQSCALIRCLALRAPCA